MMLSQRGTFSSGFMSLLFYSGGNQIDLIIQLLFYYPISLHLSPSHPHHFCALSAIFHTAPQISLETAAKGS